MKTVIVTTTRRNLADHAALMNAVNMLASAGVSFTVEPKTSGFDLIVDADDAGPLWDVATLPVAASVA